jgi:O-methyltransferase involved in polyketide biosynthesis
MEEKISPALYGVAETLLIPLHLRATETRRPDALLKDETAVRLQERIDYDFSRIHLQGHDVLGLVLRVREFDRFVRDFMDQNPKGVVVHIGCGLDTRFERVDNGKVEWYDLELPEVVHLRRALMSPQSSRYHLLEGSVFEADWMEIVGALKLRPILFITEGVLPYFDNNQVRALVVKLRTTFPGSELVFDASQPWVKFTDNFQLMFSRMKARLKFSMRNPRELETWASGISLKEEWYYFGTDEPRVRPFKWMYSIGFLRHTTGIFHYRLG